MKFIMECELKCKEAEAAERIKCVAYLTLASKHLSIQKTAVMSMEARRASAAQILRDCLGLDIEPEARHWEYLLKLSELS